MSNQKSKVTRQAEEIKRLSLMIEKHEDQLHELAQKKMIEWMREVVADYDKTEERAGKLTRNGPLDRRNTARGEQER